MRLIVVVLLAGLLTGAGAAPSHADFAAGLEAYDAGDFETAAAEWRPLAEAGSAEAQVALADLYHNGLGVPADTAAAARWYRRAAAQGDAVAQLNLGDFYSRGRGVARDLAEAYAWLTLAAAQGRAWAERRRHDILPLLSEAEHAKAEALIAERRQGE